SEDELFIQAIQKQIGRAQSQGVLLEEQVLFCLVPRHPQRFDEVAKKLESAGLSYMRRSAFVQTGEMSAVNARMITQGRQLVLLGDSIGEMPRYYAASHVAIIAGSFLPFGGQNLIEACATGVPVLVGPHTENFSQAVFDAIQEGAALRVPTAEAAVQQALTLLDEPQRLSRMTQAGTQWVSKHTGAVARVLTGLNELKAERKN
ncbi:MAG TPA: 3-deoxy-D-manno-octulosonic acid transferase, partial [Pusillimonas sp.]|nr:3-deoxy-D-manno-octulosonic acid transferase [Pusillimonas sp.]